MHRLLIGAGVLAGLLSGSAAAPVLAQDSPSAAALLRQAYEISQTANSPDQFQKVIDLCDQAFKGELDDANSKYGKELKAWALNKRGETAADAGDDKKALADFEEALTLDSNNWRARHNRAISYAMAGKFDEAADDFAAVIKVKPDFAKVWFNRAELRAMRNDLKGAIDDYNKALSLVRNDAQALASRGNAYHRLGEHQKALDDFNRALQAQPDLAVAYVQRAAVLADFGRYPEAADDYRAAVRLAPDFGPAYQAAAWLMATCPDPRFRDSQRAVLAAEKAIELDGDEDFHYLDTLGAAQASAGEFEKAVQTQQKAIAAAGDDQEVVAELKARLALYQKREPYHESRPNE